jgi:hypothetical protein
MVGETFASEAPGEDIARVDVDRVALTDRPLGLAPSVPGEVRFTSDRPGRLELEATAPAAQLLTVSESYHAGWRGSVDGEPVAVERVNGDFLGAVVPPGRHRVTFEFAPSSVRIGRRLSLLGVAVTIALIVLAGRLHQRERAAVTA